MNNMRQQSARTIKVTSEAKESLAKTFKCSERMVYKALCFECDTDLARRIRYVARKEMRGGIEATAPEAEIFYDTIENGERIMRQYFNNGAVLSVSFKTGHGVVMFKGEPKSHYDKVMVSDIPEIQNWAATLR